MDFTSVLNMAAPSFNYNKQSGADGADHVDLGTLRGLGPDQTLVLINGKRATKQRSLLYSVQEEEEIQVRSQRFSTSSCGQDRDSA